MSCDLRKSFPCPPRARTWLLFPYKVEDRSLSWCLPWGGLSAPGQHGSQDRRNTRSTRREGLGVGGPWLWPSLSHFDPERIIKTKGGAQFIEGEPETQRRLKLPSFTQLCRCDLWGTVGRSQAWGQSLPLLASATTPSDIGSTLILPSPPSEGARWI